MTNEKMLTLLNRYLETENIMELNELKQGLEENIREQSNRKVNKNLARSMNNIIKTAKKDNARVSFHGSFYNNEWLTVTDGYRAIQTRDPIELETLEQDKPLNVSSFFEPGYNSNGRIELPTIQELNAYIKIKKAERTNRHEIITLEIERTDGEMLYLNAELLKDIITSEEYVLTYQQGNTLSPVIFEGRNTRSLLLPVRTPNNK